MLRPLCKDAVRQIGSVAASGFVDNPSGIPPQVSSGENMLEYLRSTKKQFKEDEQRVVRNWLSADSQPPLLEHLTVTHNRHQGIVEFIDITGICSVAVPAASKACIPHST